MQPNLWDGKGQERLGWMHIISTFIAQSVRKIGTYHEYDSREVDFLVSYCPLECTQQNA
jgi:hypothetical protein